MLYLKIPSMKRKIIQMAGKTMVVSLPADWVKRFNIKKGEEIDLIESGSKLIVGTGKSLQEEKIKIKISGPSKLIRRYIGNLYKKGYDEIDVRFDDMTVLKEIEKHLELFVGFEIVEHGKNYCIIKDIAYGKESELNTMFRKSFFTTLSLADESLIAIQKKEYDKLKEIARLEYNQNKQYIFCLRILNKYGYKLHKKYAFMYLLVERLEEICDEYRYICDYLYVNGRKLKVKEEILKFFKDVNGMLKLLYDCYYLELDEKKIEDTIKIKEKLAKQGFDLLSLKSKPQEIVILHHLINLTDKIYEALSPVLALRIY